MPICANLVDFEKCFFKIYFNEKILAKSASIQPRTSPDKLAVRLDLASPDLEFYLSYLLEELAHMPPAVPKEKLAPKRAHGIFRLPYTMVLY